MKYKYYLGKERNEGKNRKQYSMVTEVSIGKQLLLRMFTYGKQPRAFCTRKEMNNASNVINQILHLYIIKVSQSDCVQ